MNLVHCACAPYAITFPSQADPHAPAIAAGDTILIMAVFASTETLFRAAILVRGSVRTGLLWIEELTELGISESVLREISISRG